MMKVTLFFVSVFFVASIWSGAFEAGTDFLLMLLGAALVFVAWLDDKKEQQRIKELKSRQLDRSMRWSQVYQSRSQKRKFY